MNGIHEVTGSIPVWSTNSLYSFGRRRTQPVLSHAADAARPPAASIPVWSTILRLPVRKRRVSALGAMRGQFTMIRNWNSTR